MASFSWDPLVVPALAASVLSLAVAIVVLALRPGRPQNQWMALLFFDAAAIFGFDFVLRLLTDDLRLARAAGLVGNIALTAVPALYLQLASTLPTPGARHLSRPLVRGLAFGYTLAVWAAFVFRPEWAAPSGWEYGQHVDTWGYRGGPLIIFVNLAIVPAFLTSLVLAIRAWRRAKTPALRAQTRAYVVAFGTNELLQTAFALFLTRTRAAYDAGGLPLTWLGAPLIHILFVGLLGYGILRGQLFDLHLRIKTGFGRTVALGAAAGAFFLVSEIAEGLVGGVVPGLVAAAVVALGFFPIQRWVVRSIDRFVPRHRDTPEYRTARKRDVYQAALEELQADGSLSERDRRYLDGLRRRLALTK